MSPNLSRRTTIMSAISESGLSAYRPGKTEAPFNARASCTISTARRERGTRCSFLAFILSAGTVHPLLSRSTSAGLAPNTSPVLAAVSGGGAGGGGAGGGAGGGRGGAAGGGAGGGGGAAGGAARDV